MWDDVKQKFPVGQLVHGVVSKHWPFGIFVDIGDDEATGVVNITEFTDDGRMSPDLYPAIGTPIEGIVLGHSDSKRKQIGIGMKPSQLNLAPPRAD